MSLKSVALGIITFIIVSLLTIGLSFAEDFNPVMPNTLTVEPSGITTGSTPLVIVSGFKAGGPHPTVVAQTIDQVQVVISSATATYYDGWHTPYEVYGSWLSLLVNVPIGTEYVISVRGWNNNGFGEWTISDPNTVVSKGTDCWSNSVQTRPGLPSLPNPACQ